jgi:hypothetical protein
MKISTHNTANNSLIQIIDILKQIHINKFTLLFIIFVLYVSFANARNTNCKHVIAPEQTIIDASKMDVQPGDTVCIEASVKRMLLISNFHGTAENYIVFKNCGGEVIVKNNDLTYGICIDNSSYFRFTGAGVDGTNYGIRILETMIGGSMGIKVGNKSTNYEIDHIEIANVGFAGIMAKTDPKSDLSSNRDSFTQYQSIFHDNYIHNTGGEGIYIGHSFYNGMLSTVDGKEITLYPSALKGVRVFKNRIDSTGWDGIQVGSANEDCEIFGNSITNYGLSAEPSQQSGIQINPGTTGKCYNNYIANGTGNGMSVFGLGNNDIYNNIIQDAGYNGIFLDDRGTIAGSSFNFFNNTIVNPKADGIRFYSVLSKNNKFHNNIILNPGSLLTYSKYSKQNPYINIGAKTGIDAIISNNFMDSNFDKIQFEDVRNNNFKLMITSPAIEAGLDLSNFGVDSDFEFKARPIGRNYDLGAYQRVSATETKLETKPVANFAVFPNPCNGKFEISREETSTVNVTIHNILGKVVQTSKNSTDKNLKFDISGLASNGKYFVTISDENGSSTRTIIIQ